MCTRREILLTRQNKKKDFAPSSVRLIRVFLSVRRLTAHDEYDHVAKWRVCSIASVEIKTSHADTSAHTYT